MTQKLQQTECTKCGQHVTETRDYITQQWDLTPITRTQATWVAFLRSDVLAIKTTTGTWRAITARGQVRLPSTYDPTDTWLPLHRCHHPPIFGASEPITLTPPNTQEFDLFNQPTDDPPPY